MLKRPWRNSNPLNLRPVALPDKWNGQVAVDEGPGGPFAIFMTRPEGWRAACVCLLTYQDRHDLLTIRGIIGRWAPGEDHNDTGAYVRTVCHLSGFAANEVLELHKGTTMLKVVKAMATVEGGADIEWPQDEILAGIRLAGLII